MIDVLLEGGPHDGKKGHYYGPDEQTVRTLYVTDTQVAYYSSEPDSAFTPGTQTLVYRRAGMVPDDVVVFVYGGKADPL